jgi:hypothetical protein
MNINQVLSIFDWNVKTFHKNRMPGLFVSEYGDYLTYLTIINGSDTDIIFNHVTSEVIFVDTLKYFYLNVSNENIINEYFLSDSNRVDENEILNILCDINKKEHDGILDLTVEDDVLTVIDNSADKLNISRQQFVAKVLIDYIRKQHI